MSVAQEAEDDEARAAAADGIATFAQLHARIAELEAALQEVKQHEARPCLHVACLTPGPCLWQHECKE